MDVLRDLKWWIGGLFGLGVAVVTAFGPELLPELARWSAFAFGVSLIVVSGGMLGWHVWRAPKTLGAWKKMDPLRLDQAAWCWCGKPPEQEMAGHHDVYFQFEKLRLAIMQKKLTPKWGAIQWAMFDANRMTGVAEFENSDAHIVSASTPVSRASLLRYGESIGDIPDFLKD